MFIYFLYQYLFFLVLYSYILIIIIIFLTGAMSLSVFNVDDILEHIFDWVQSRDMLLVCQPCRLFKSRRIRDAQKTVLWLVAE